MLRTISPSKTHPARTGNRMSKTPDSGVSTHLDTVQERLNRLHDRMGLSWRQIAARGEYGDIPHGTLCAIAKGREPYKG